MTTSYGEASPRASRDAAPVDDFADIFNCAKCGGRLLGRPAREAKRCSGDCLDGELKDRYVMLEQWRQERATALDLPLAKVATDKALFGATIDGSSASVLGFNREAGPAPL